jgi:hypothetical protein
VSATEIQRELRGVYGQNVMNEKNESQWLRMFQKWAKIFMKKSEVIDQL